MNLYIHGNDGTVTEYAGIQIDGWLPIGYSEYPEVEIPYGDFGDGELVCVRHDDEKYEDDEYDVAEYCYDNNDDENNND